jgi:glycosyltransferase involved in cell wall biosynthesis
MEYAREAQIPGLLEVNAPLIEEQAEYRGLTDRVAAERVAERVFKAASALIAVSEEVAAYLKRYPATRDRVRVVPNGVNPRRFPQGAPASHARAPGAFTVGFVGTLKPWHGLSTLVKAFARLRRSASEARLLIVGDGPERPALEAALAADNLQQAAQFTGAVVAHEVAGFLASMDVAVAPYPPLAHFYFSPLKVYEYMAAGLPVVASRIGQLATLIRHEVTGLLCPPGDPEALAAALDRLRREPALRSRLGQAARTEILGKHTWQAVVRQVLGLAGLEKASRPLLKEQSH